MFKTTRNLAIIFFILVIFGFLLMVMTYSLPNDNVNEMVTGNEIVFPPQNILYKDYTTSLDLYTEKVILSELSFYNQNLSLTQNAMSVYGTSGNEAYDQYVSGDESCVDGYARYWHGNLVPLKILFLFFDYYTIKILEYFFEFILLIAVIKACIENNLKNYIVPFLLGLFFIHPEVIGLSFQFSTVYDIMLIAIFIQIKFKDILFKKERLLYYFLIVGMATSFFDLLTYPLLSFGGPMIFYLLLERDKKSLKDNLKSILMFGFIWAIGFFGMWFSKWVIASLVLNQNIIVDGIINTLIRTSSTEFTRIDAVLSNMFIYKKKSYAIIMILISAYYIKRIIAARRNITYDDLKRVLPYAAIAALPFIWYFLLSNHSYIHFWFTYRELFIFFFALMCAVENLLNKKISKN